MTDFLQKKILIMALADPSASPRPRRMIELAKSLGLQVHAATHSTNNSFFEKFYEIKRLSTKRWHSYGRILLNYISVIVSSARLFDFINSYRAGFQNLHKNLQDQSCDLIIVEDLYLLPLAFKVKKNAKVVFDAREYYPDQLSHKLIWRYTERLNRIRICKKYLYRCDAVLTVSGGIAEKYKEEFGISCIVVRSVPNFTDHRPSETPHDKIRMVHHGSANSNRRIENMIHIFSKLDKRFELDFYLTGNEDYKEKLRKLASPYPQIQFHPPVKFENIVPTINKYDVGLCFLEDTTFNLRHSLPNKLFEFIQGRVAVVTGPSPDMSKLVMQYDCGISIENFDYKTLAMRLNALTTGQISQMKNNSDVAATELCFEKEKLKIISLFGKLLNQAFQ